VVIGPDRYIVGGLADACDDAGLLVFGTRKRAAKLEGSKCYANLPLRLKTMELLHYTLEKDPDCLNYTTNPSVLANREEFDAFLEHQMPGLAKLVQTIMATTNFSPRQAYESALATQALTVTSEQLPTFDFSDFGIPA
jgi:hypothetical protein